MLALARPLVHALGIDPALITCDDTNVASRRVIEANGGSLASASDGILRFWVPTAPQLAPVPRRCVYMDQWASSVGGSVASTY